MFKAMGDDHVREVMGSNPGAVYWMDMTFFKFICCKNCIVCLKRPKINANEAGVGPFLEKKTILLQHLVSSECKLLFLA